MNHPIQEQLEQKSDEIAQFTATMNMNIAFTLNQLEKQCEAAEDDFLLPTIGACRVLIAEGRKKADTELEGLMYAMAVMEDVLQMPDPTVACADEMPEEFIVPYRMYRMRTSKQRREEVCDALMAIA